MFGIGMTELLIVLVVGLLVIGPKKLPELARTLGRGLAEFRRASTEMRREFLDVAESTRIDPPAEDPPAKDPPGEDPSGESPPAKGDTGDETSGSDLG
jgi:TatA/E family protein of Tat protein translocase